MSAVFLNRSAPIKTKEQKKVSRLAKKTTTARRNLMKPGPVTVIVYPR